jgi:hypothetical protein
MADKKTHFGRAGEYFAMSELLLRGWNVAVPVVDVGDDVFVIDDNDKTTWRLQVKSSTAEASPREGAPAALKAKFMLSRSQLRTAQPIELFYMLMVRAEKSWRFFVVPRVELLRIRDAYVEAGKNREGPGRRPVGDQTAKRDGLPLEVVLEGDAATGWDVSLAAFCDTWPDELAPVVGGPGAVRRAAQAQADGDERPAEDPNPPAEDPGR